MRKILLLVVVVLALVLAPVQAFGADPDFDPFPVGTCVTLSVADAKPICVILDPDQ